MYIPYFTPLTLLLWLALAVVASSASVVGRDIDLSDHAGLSSVKRSGRSLSETAQGSRTVACSDDQQLANAVLASEVDVALITTDISISKQTWAQYASIPVGLRRPLILLGANDEVERWPVLDLAAAASLVCPDADNAGIDVDCM